MSYHYPKVKCSSLGTVIRAKWNDVDAKIYATLQYAGDATAGSSFKFKDNGGADLVFEDDTFGLSWSHDNSTRLLGSFHISGDTDISDWFSTDDGKTWQLLS